MRQEDEEKKQEEETGMDTRKEVRKGNNRWRQLGKYGNNRKK